MLLLQVALGALVLDATCSAFSPVRKIFYEARAAQGLHLPLLYLMFIINLEFQPIKVNVRFSEFALRFDHVQSISAAITGKLSFACC